MHRTSLRITGSALKIAGSGSVTVAGKRNEPGNVQENLPGLTRNAIQCVTHEGS